jgi:hypothetical protein
MLTQILTGGPRLVQLGIDILSSHGHLSRVKAGMTSG